MRAKDATPGRPADRRVHYSAAEKKERRALGLPASEAAPSGMIKPLAKGRRRGGRKGVAGRKGLNGAPDEAGSLMRSMRVDLPGGLTLMVFSRTASVSPDGETVYPGDFRAQLWRTYHNLTKLLAREGATWNDVVRTNCYLCDLERDYDESNSIRGEFFHALGLDPFPAGIGIQARLCRSDLLVEIEAIAILVKE